MTISHSQSSSFKKWADSIPFGQDFADGNSINNVFSCYLVWHSNIEIVNSGLGKWFKIVLWSTLSSWAMPQLLNSSEEELRVHLDYSFLNVERLAKEFPAAHWSNSRHQIGFQIDHDSKSWSIWNEKSKLYKKVFVYLFIFED